MGAVALTLAGDQLTRQHRQAQLQLRAATLADLVTLWDVVDPANLPGTIGPFTSAATTVVQARHATSAGLAASYFEAFRAAEGIPGRAAPRLAASLPADAAAGALRGSALAGIVNARRAGLSIEEALRQGLVRVSGQATTLVLSGGRETILRSGAADPRRPRWARVSGGDSCAFCAMLASRGPVFRSEDTAGFEAHDHCVCEPELAYEGAGLSDRARALRDQWDEVTAGLSGRDALNAFRRARSGG